MKPWAISGAIILMSAAALAGCGTGAPGQSTHPTAQATSGRVTHHTAKRSGRPTLSTAPRFNPQSIDMVSPSVGWAWSQDAVWWTRDGGRHWIVETPTTLPHDSTLTVQVVSQNVAWVAVANNLTPTPPFPVWITTTHGTLWDRTTSLPHNDYGVSFISAVSAHVAWMATDLVGASGTESMVLDATMDGGKIWTTLPSSVSSQMMAQPDAHPKSAHPIPLFGDKSGRHRVRLAAGGLYHRRPDGSDRRKRYAVADHRRWRQLEPGAARSPAGRGVELDIPAHVLQCSERRHGCSSEQYGGRYLCHP